MSLPADTFNDGVVRVHMCLAEGGIADAASALVELAQAVVRGSTGTGSGGPSSGSSRGGGLSVCPHCQRRTASLSYHLRTCPAARAAAASGPASSGSTGSNGGSAAPVVDPVVQVQKEMLDGLKDKVVAAARAQLKALPATAEVMEQMFALWRAMAVLGDVEGASTFDDRLVGVFKAGCADVLRDFEAMRSIDQLRNPHAGGGTAVASSPQQPHVTTVTSLLAYGAQVVSRVLEERVPHAAKTALAFAVHNACAACVVDVLKIFARDMRLGDLLARSAQLHQRQVRSPAGGAGGASSGSGAGAGGMTAEAVEGLVTSVAEALDQLAYLVQLCEQYLRDLARVLSIGSDGEATRSLRGPLVEQTQELLGNYVMLDRGMTAYNVSKAIEISEPAELDDGVLADSLADDAFFVLAAALQRAFATRSELVSSATINHVTALLDEDVRAALLRAVAVCTGAAVVGLYRAESVDEAGEAEDALGAALAEALAQSSGPKSGRSSQDGGDDSRDDGALSRRVVVALNTVALSTNHAASLGQRAHTAVTESAEGAVSEQMNMLLAEFDRVITTFQQFVEEAARGVANKLVEGHMRQLSSIVRGTSCVLDLPAYEALVADNPVTDWLVHTVLRGGEVATRLARLNRDAADTVVRQLSTIVASHLEKVWTQHKFNEVGGMWVDSTLRGLIEALSRLLHRGSVRSTFARLQQVAFVLTLERLGDLYQCEYPGAVLTNQELSAVARCRVDFNKAGVDGLIFDSIPCSLTFAGGVDSGPGSSGPPRSAGRK